MRKFRRTVQIVAVVATIALAGAIAASAEPVASSPSFTAAPDVIAGRSPDGLGTWSVQYQRSMAATRRSRRRSTRVSTPRRRDRSSAKRGTHRHGAPGNSTRQGRRTFKRSRFQSSPSASTGIELHFPDYQFGRGLKVMTVPWAHVADPIAPEFQPIMV
ncbi:MAG: hypothetical protein QOD39_4117 [Mycobacterium sp.]|jgi:hypothetical protein|nr:hypothetical protein [Mycobacterium sp.]